MTSLVPPDRAERTIFALETHFSPPAPKNSRDIVLLFAVAAKVACDHPSAVEGLGHVVGLLRTGLIPPESLTFAECERLWVYFARVVTLPKPALRKEAGRAFFRELDALSERLDMPSLPDWEKLPASLTGGLAPLSSSPTVPTALSEGLDLTETRKKARAALALSPSGLEAELVGGLFRQLNVTARETLLADLVGRGVLTRSELNLLVHYLAKDKTPPSVTGALTDSLCRLGKYLGESKP